MSLSEYGTGPGEIEGPQERLSSDDRGAGGGRMGFCQAQRAVRRERERTEDDEADARRSGSGRWSDGDRRRGDRDRGEPQEVAGVGVSVHLRGAGPTVGG